MGAGQWHSDIVDEGFDYDEDGFARRCGDCDDNNASINAEFIEIPGNDVDENCDGFQGNSDPNADWEVVPIPAAICLLWSGFIGLVGFCIIV